MVLHEFESNSRVTSLPAGRQRIIRGRLTRDGQVNASVLAKEPSTSEDTIRHDLRDLAVQGFYQRVYGGAVLLSAASAPITVRARETHARKEAFGRGISKLLRIADYKRPL
jgi:DeoR/GlpR family transcriptional regulator of sugar metabolism